MDKLELVDEAYEAKMLAFEINCREGTGEPMGCHNVAEFYSVVKDDHSRAAATYQLNCDNKNFAPSCFNLAKLYFAGRGVKQDEGKAMKYFEKACNYDHLASCYHYGALLYLSNPDSQQEVAKAMNVLESACVKGSPESCYFAAGHLVKPENPKRDPVKAMKFFKISCESKHAPSCFNLAVMYNKGDVGVPSDSVKFEEYKRQTDELVKTYGGKIEGTKKG